MAGALARGSPAIIEACRGSIRSTNLAIAMINIKKCVILFLIILSLAPFGGMAEVLGDPAPALVIKEWIRGGPVDIKPGTNIYVVVIWGTKNAAADKTITKLNELQKKYKDQGVIVVGVSDETPDRIRNFVEHSPVPIEYAIGADTARRTAISYMLGFKLHTIPRAFLVGKDGNFLWQGDPMRGLDVMLGEVVAGRYELARAKQTDTIRVQMESYRTMAHRGDPRARAVGETLMEGWTNNVRQLCDFAYFIVNDTRNQARDFTLAGRALDLAEKASPTNTLRLLNTRVAFLIESGKPEEALSMYRAAITAATDPKEKTELESYLKKAEARINAKKSRNNSPATNSVTSANGTNSPVGGNGSGAKSNAAKRAEPKSAETEKSSP